MRRCIEVCKKMQAGNPSYMMSALFSVYPNEISLVQSYPICSGQRANFCSEQLYIANGYIYNLHDACMAPVNWENVTSLTVPIFSVLNAF